MKQIFVFSATMQKKEKKMSNKNKSIELSNELYKIREPMRKQINTLYAGTHAMREAGQDYLPKFPLESDNKYTSRLKQTFLLNQTKTWGRGY